jgi:hypothetical protein
MNPKLASLVRHVRLLSPHLRAIRLGKIDNNYTQTTQRQAVTVSHKINVIRLEMKWNQRMKNEDWFKFKLNLNLIQPEKVTTNKVKGASESCRNYGYGIKPSFV